MSATNIRELTSRSKKETANQMGGQLVQQFFEANKAAIAAAMPRHADADRMLKVATHALRTTPGLRECNMASLMGAVIQCSQLGLEPNTVLGHAYLVPFWNGQRKRKEAQLIPGYKGLIDLARRSGQILSISAHEVCERDNFDFRLGTNAGIDHVPAMSDRGAIIGFYAVAHMVGGGYQFEFMSREEVERIRDGSQGYQSAQKYKKDHPWISHFVAMGRKTAIRRLSKYLPLSIEFATANALDGVAEGGQSQGLDEVLTGDYRIVDPDEPMPSAEQSESPEAEAEAPAPEPEAEAKDPAAGYVERMETCDDPDKLAELMDWAKDELAGQKLATVTKAYKRNQERLQQSGSAEGLFGGDK